MRRTITACLFATGLAVYSGCPQPVVTSDGSAVESASFSEAREADGADRRATPERLAVEQRDRYVRRMRNKMDQKRDAIAAIAALVSNFEGERKGAGQATVDRLETQADEIRKKIDEIAEADPYGWTELRQGVTDAWIDLERAVDEAARDVTIENNRGESDGSTEGPKSLAPARKSGARK
jgi:acyl-CoA reductase-like NAD-dependent aldehyde dehydrogenase